jgi:predicted tellurium resistance membrane protein TerC
MAPPSGRPRAEVARERTLALTSTLRHPHALSARSPERHKAIRVGLILAMVFRIALLAGISLVLAYATRVFWAMDTDLLGTAVSAAVNGKAVVLALGGLLLIWKGIKELRVKLKGVHETAVKDRASFRDVVAPC